MTLILINAHADTNTQNNLINSANELQKAVPQLRQQVINTIEQVNSAQKQVSNQLDTLKQQNSALQSKVEQLTNQLTNTQRQTQQQSPVLTLPTPENQPVAIHQPTVATMPSALNTLFDFKLGLGLVILIILILVWLFWRQPQRTQPITQQRNQEPTLTTASNTDESGEYDLMNSDEAIPIKLDLARAYIDMGDYEAAKEALTSVLAKGQQEHKTEAQALLTKIKA